MEEGTYFVYRKGYHPDELALGHLVLEDYANPSKRKFQPFPRLSDNDLQRVANIYPWKGKLITTAKTRLGFGVRFLGIGEAAPMISFENSHTITADGGRRVELKNPAEFFSQVLKNSDSRSKLQLWASVTRSQYLRRRIGLGLPKIWMLTGLLELNDGTVHAIKGNERGLKLELDPLVTAALSGVGVGASIDLGHGVTLDLESQLGGTAVYAAKFQLLRAEYKAWDREAGLALTEFQLHPDTTFAGGVVLGEGDETEEIAQISVQTSEDMEIEHGDTDDDYWEAFEEAEERMLDDLM